MKNKLSFLLLSLIITGFLSCQQKVTNKGQNIILTNTSSIDLIDKAIAIKHADISSAPGSDLLPLLINSSGDTIPAQLDDPDGDNKWDELFFVVNLPSGGTETIQLSWVDSLPDFVKKTSVRFGKRLSGTTPVKPLTGDTIDAKHLTKNLGYQPYQTDGPSWENDKVGFRDYLDGRNSKDLFGKKVAGMSPETVGINAQGDVEDNYHVMSDWGRDIMAVDNSVGLGGYALLTRDDILRLGIIANDTVNNVEKTIFRIAAEGPVRSILNYQFENWKSDDRNYSVNESTSIWPGMYAYQNSVTFSGLKGDEEMLIGLANINTDMPLAELKVNDKYVVLYTHDQQSYKREWWLGLALILPLEQYLGYMSAPGTGQLTSTFLAKLNVEDGQPVDYFAVGCWELSDPGFVDSTYFVNYLKNLANQLAAEVTIDIE